MLTDGVYIITCIIDIFTYGVSAQVCGDYKYLYETSAGIYRIPAGICGVSEDLIKFINKYAELPQVCARFAQVFTKIPQVFAEYKQMQLYI